MSERAKERFLNPYIAGFLLGLVVLVSFVILGSGLGASSGIARIAAYASLIIARSRTLLSEHFGAWGDAPLNFYLVFMLLGIFCGGIVSALFARRFALDIERGLKCGVILRIVFALVGGVLVGFAARLSRGCTSGQALSGSSLLLAGSFVFLICIFIGGVATARLFRRQWDD